MPSRFPSPHAAMALAIAACLAVPAHAATVTVTSSADNSTVDGQCTLREAIAAVNTGADGADCVGTGNAWGTADTVAFNIPGAGVHILQPTIAYNPFLVPVRVNGYSQPGAAPNTLAGRDYPGAQGLDTAIRIEIDGSLVGGSNDGLRFNAPNSTVQGLSIVRFGNGAALWFAGASAVVGGNFLGVRADGQTPGANRYGIRISGANNVTIGGPAAADRNLIAGNSDQGIFANGANGLSLSGNLIGTDASGTQALSPLATGLLLVDSIVADISANLVAGHGQDGLVLQGAQNASVMRNTIGAGVGGSAPGNRSGIVLRNSAGLPSRGNLVYGNGITASQADGILVVGDATAGDAFGNRLDNNAIYANAGLGIDLQPAGETAGSATANDGGDADAGPNALQNFPVVVSAQVNGTGGIAIAFTLDSTPNTQFDLSAYANPSCNASGHGEGRYGTGGLNQPVTTDGGGHAAGTITVAAPLPAGWSAGSFVSLLAHDVVASNTSEFSACAQVAALAGTPPQMGDVPDQSGHVGTAFSLNLAPYVTLTEGNPLTGFAVAGGSLPPGLVLSGADILAGTPTTAGVYQFTVTASDANGASNADAVQFSVSATPPAGVPPAMGDVPDQPARVGTPFVLDLSAYVTPTDGDPVTGYAIASGNLPPGLVLQGSRILGQPTAAGSFLVTVAASDTDGTGNADSVRFTVAAAPGGVAPIPTLSEWGQLLAMLLLAAAGLLQLREPRG